MIRELDWASTIGQEVRVYRNLNNGKISLQTKQHKGWIVAGHITDCILKSVNFHVSESGRQRVIAQSTKNVHAWGQGTLIAQFDATVAAPISLAYNPYVNATFVDQASQQSICRCRYLVVRDNAVWVSSDAVAAAPQSQLSIAQNLLQLPLFWQPALCQTA